MRGLSGLHDSLFILDRGWPTEPWALVFSRFAHKTLGHLGNNFWGLVVLAPIAERLLHGKRFLVFYLAASMLAGLAGLAGGAGSSVGASGGVFALVGLLLVAVGKRWGKEVVSWWQAGRPFSARGSVAVYFSPRPHELVALVVCLYQVWGLAQWQPATAIGRTGNVAHLAGLILGVGYALWCATRGRGLANLPR